LRCPAGIAPQDIRPVEPDRQASLAGIHGMGERVIILGMICMAPGAAIGCSTVISSMFLAVTAVIRRCGMAGGTGIGRKLRAAPGRRLVFEVAVCTGAAVGSRCGRLWEECCVRSVP
jgi:hypothetical protein